MGLLLATMMKKLECLPRCRSNCHVLSEIVGLLLASMMKKSESLPRWCFNCQRLVGEVGLLFASMMNKFDAYPVAGFLVLAPRTACQVDPTGVVEFVQVQLGGILFDWYILPF